MLLCMVCMYIGLILGMTGSDDFLEELTWHVEAKDGCWRAWNGRVDTHRGIPLRCQKEGGDGSSKERSPVVQKTVGYVSSLGANLPVDLRLHVQGLPLFTAFACFFSSWLIFTMPLFHMFSLPWSAVTFLARLTFEQGARRLGALQSEWQLLCLYPALLAQH